MDIAISPNKSIYAYNPGACITRYNPYSKENEGYISALLSKPAKADTVEFSKTKNIETTEAIEDTKDENLETLISKAETMVTKAAKLQEAAYRVIENRQGVADDAAEQNGGLPDICTISVKYNENGAKEYEINEDDENAAKNAINTRFGKVRSCYTGRKEDDDLILKTTEVKATNDAKVTDAIQNCTSSKDNEGEYLKCGKHLHCNYDGQPEFYATGYEYNPLNGIQHWDEYLDFDNKTGKPLHYYTDINVSPSGYRSYEEHLRYSGGKWEAAS